MPSTGSIPAKALSGEPLVAAVTGQADAIPWQTGPDSVPTHFGMVGLLQETAMVVDLGAPQPCGTRLIHYRRSSGALLSLAIPASTAVAPGDFLLVKALTWPDGAVRPVAIRPPASEDWVSVADVDAILQGYCAGTSRFVRWGAGVGSICGIAALCGIAAPVSALAGAVAAVSALGLHRKDRRDRARVRRLAG